MSEQRKTTVAAVAAVVAAVVSVLTLVALLLGGFFVDEDELREGLKATEDSIKSAIEASTQRTDAQMEELRGYIVNHLDRHATGGEQPAN